MRLKKMELMDWKEIELGAKNAIRQAEKDTIIAEILLKNAHKYIEAMGGKTIEQEEAAAKEEMKKQDARTV